MGNCASQEKRKFLAFSIRKGQKLSEYGITKIQNPEPYILEETEDCYQFHDYI